ncbi:MAG TPA: molybdate ABC transporter substrate-binding protein [Xanthobacteraceae bacterium]|jgi:molybdate transport system substrate-binding protein|nr:molybdate ABC transporter substrate-binding protein [Xanthobacteraceae bacterium]
MRFGSGIGMKVALAAVAGVLGFAGAAGAAEITVLASQGALSGVRDLAAGFEKATGNKVNVSFEAGNALNEKIEANAPADLVTNTLDSFDDLIKRGKIVSGSVVEFARAGNGVAVKAGTLKRDISTPEAFKQAMLNSGSIGHTNAGTGPFNTKLFQKLGIYDMVKGKVKIIVGRPVAAAVADGTVEIGIQQTNVIQPFAGTEYLGPLPKELMEYGRFGVGVLAISKEAETAKAFIKFMAAPESAALIRKSAMETPQS